MKRLLLAALLLSSFAALPALATAAQTGSATVPHVVEPGDTWAALAARYQMDATTLRAASAQMNTQLEPVIGDTIRLPAGASERPGRLLRAGSGGLLANAAGLGLSPWALASANGLGSPYQPTFYRPLYAPVADSVVRDLPVGLSALELSQPVAAPGQALAFRATAAPGLGLTSALSVTASLGGRPWGTGGQGDLAVGIGGLNAFFGEGTPELRVRVADNPPWAQPWRVRDREWIYQELSLTGEAAEIDQAGIQAERERLTALWGQVSPEAQWAGPFRLPVDDYLEISAPFGARRSYNGGPYRSFHEGVDFSAYGGTPVYAPAAGTVVLAERLFVRGGAVIIDHGLGLYTGYYHLSNVTAGVGQQVQPGDKIGEVGTTGLSTGNHLHWDMLARGVNVDAALWMEQNLACWLLDGLGRPCETADGQGS